MEPYPKNTMHASHKSSNHGRLVVRLEQPDLSEVYATFLRRVHKALQLCFYLGYGQRHSSTQIRTCTLMRLMLTNLVNGFPVMLLHYTTVQRAYKTKHPQLVSNFGGEVVLHLCHRVHRRLPTSYLHQSPVRFTCACLAQLFTVYKFGTTDFRPGVHFDILRLQLACELGAPHTISLTSRLQAQRRQLLIRIVRSGISRLDFTYRQRLATQVQTTLTTFLYIMYLLTVATKHGQVIRNVTSVRVFRYSK